MKDKDTPNRDTQAESDDSACVSTPSKHKPEEIGGVKGPEPTRFGDWEKNGRCVDF